MTKARQSKNLRKGWQSENLANYLLHEIAFISQPLQVTDDFGIDFFCTLFYKDDKGKMLYPQDAFALQIKSNTDNFPEEFPAIFLDKLEIPFLVGVANKEKNKLTIFSGRYLPAFLSYKGNKVDLKIQIGSDNKLSYREENFWEEDENSHSYILKFPEIVELYINDSQAEKEKNSTKLRKECFRIYKNILSRKNKEFIFAEKVNKKVFIQAYAGGTSIKRYRFNLLKALIQAFVNLNKIYKKDRSSFVVKEFKALKKLLKQLSQVKGTNLLKDYTKFGLKIAEDYCNKLEDVVEKDK